MGYGDITPQTAVEQGVMLAVLLLGYILLGVFIGSITDMLRQARKEEQLSRHITAIQEWLIQHQQVSGSLKEPAKAFPTAVLYGIVCVNPTFL